MDEKRGQLEGCGKESHRGKDHGSRCTKKQMVLYVNNTGIKKEKEEDKGEGMEKEKEKERIRRRRRRRKRRRRRSSSQRDLEELGWGERTE